jgi:hypothetical protein
MSWLEEISIATSSLRSGDPVDPTGVNLWDDSLRSEEFHEVVVGVVWGKLELYQRAKTTSLSTPRRKPRRGDQT